MRFRARLIAGFVWPLLVLTVWLAAPPPALASPHYFIEFRARNGGVLGHTFVVYGATDERGRVTERDQAGIYPVGAFSESLILPILLVRGNVTFKKENGYALTARYRRTLSSAQYARLKRTVMRLRAQRKQWQFVLYNCNDFVAEVARSLGLRTPSTLEEPHHFVNNLYFLNER